jgi:hypothetical protein
MEKWMMPVMTAVEVGCPTNTAMEERTGASGRSGPILSQGLLARFGGSGAPRRVREAWFCKPAVFAANAIFCFIGFNGETGKSTTTHFKHIFNNYLKLC